MKLSLALLSTLLSSTAASTISTTSKLGKNLLSKARRVEDGGEQGDYAWLSNYAIQYDSCHTVTEYNFEEGGGDESPIYKNRLVKFKLCPANKCGYGCSGPEYLVDIMTFVNLYTENKLNDEEAACENVRETCDCEYAYDDDVCEAECYQAAGLSYCIENDDDGEEFDLQEYLECQQIYEDGYGVPYYVGLKCSDSGEKINLAVFTDEFCTQEGELTYYNKATGGQNLPYRYENIVAENCIDCQDIEYDEYGYAQNYDLKEVCTESYEVAAKCEQNMANDLAYPNTDACDYIANLYLREDNYKPNTIAVVLAWMFLISTLALAALSVRLHMMASNKIKLNSQTDGAVV